MMKYKIVWICCVLAFTAPWASEVYAVQGQDTIAAPLQTASKQKKEREEKITLDLFPKNAVDVVTVIGYARKKVTYYRETDGKTLSYEAKLRYQDRKYSIEFDKNGLLEDVELDSRKRRIPKEALFKISKTLDSIARRYRIEKVQEQYVAGDQNTQQIKEKIARDNFDNYELIVAFKDKRKIYRKEFLFDKNGNLIGHRDIKRLEYDFLLF
jgi:hypothetical protein